MIFFEGWVIFSLRLFDGIRNKQVVLNKLKVFSFNRIMHNRVVLNMLKDFYKD